MINWFTVAAQIVNFLILVALLRRFLYGPVIKAMDKREADIRAKLEDAEKKSNEASARERDFAAKATALEQEKDTLVAQARQAADEERKQLVQKAREAVDRQRTAWERSLAGEQDAFTQELRTELQQEIMAVLRQAFSELADADLEEQMVAALIARLKKLDATERDQFAHAAREAEGKVVVESAFDMPAALQKRIAAQLDDVVGKKVDPFFTISKDVLGGVQVNAAGIKVAWTLERHLQDLELHMQQHLDDSIERQGEDTHESDNTGA